MHTGVLGTVANNANDERIIKLQFQLVRRDSQAAFSYPIHQGLMLLARNGVMRDSVLRLHAMTGMVEPFSNGARREPCV